MYQFKRTTQSVSLNICCPYANVSFCNGYSNGLIEIEKPLLWSSLEKGNTSFYFLKKGMNTTFPRNICIIVISYSQMYTIDGKIQNQINEITKPKKEKAII